MAPGVRSVVISHSMRQADYPGVTIVNDAEPFVAELKTKPGKDIWLFGGGALFHSLLGAGLVDGIDVGVIPVLLGGGKRLFDGIARTDMEFERTGVVESPFATHIRFDVRG